jgi:hypothetical protein
VLRRSEEGHISQCEEDTESFLEEVALEHSAGHRVFLSTTSFLAKCPLWKEVNHRSYQIRSLILHICGALAGDTHCYSQVQFENYKVAVGRGGVGEEIAEEIKDEVQVCNLGHELVTLLWL